MFLSFVKICECSKKNRRITRKDTRVKRKSSVWSFFFENDDCISFSLCASWISENDRESAKMTINSWFFCFENQSISELVTTTVNCRFFFSSFRHLVNSRFFCSSRSVDIRSIDDFHVFSNQSAHSSNDFYNTHFFEALRHRLLKKRIKITHNNFIKSSNQQTITQNHQQNFRFLDLFHSQHDREILVSFRFVSSVSVNLLQWRQWVRYND